MTTKAQQGKNLGDHTTPLPIPYDSRQYYMQIDGYHVMYCQLIKAQDRQIWSWHLASIKDLEVHRKRQLAEAYLDTAEPPEHPCSTHAADNASETAVDRWPKPEPFDNVAREDGSLRTSVNQVTFL